MQFVLINLLTLFEVIFISKDYILYEIFRIKLLTNHTIYQKHFQWNSAIKVDVTRFSSNNMAFTVDLLLLLILAVP